jgi:hypothetical protein
VDFLEDGRGDGKRGTAASVLRRDERRQVAIVGETANEVLWVGTFPV